MKKNKPRCKCGRKMKTQIYPFGKFSFEIFSICPKCGHRISREIIIINVDTEIVHSPSFTISDMWPSSLYERQCGLYPFFDEAFFTTVSMYEKSLLAKEYKAFLNSQYGRGIL